MLVTRLRWEPSDTSGGTLHFDALVRPCPPAELDALDARARTTLGEAWPPTAAGTVGVDLWRWLDGEDHWLAAVTASLAAGHPWRVEIADPRGVLSHLAWELLHDGSSHLAQRMPWFMPVRRVDDGRGDLPPDEAPQHDLGVLFMAASPRGAVTLDYEAEEIRILDACRSDGDIFLTVEESGTLDGLGLRLTDLETRWEVVHLTCHGSHASLALESDTGALDAVPPNRLKVGLGARLPTLLSLSACLTAARTEANHNSYASAMARAGVGAVLGFASRVDDDRATTFVAALYGHLGHAEALCEALARTRYEALQADPFGDELSKANHPAVWGASRLFLTRAVAGLAAPSQARVARRLTRRPDPGAFLRAMGKDIKTAPAARFVGRRRALQRLIACLRQGTRIGAFVQGLGGAGKSSLVARALRRVALRPVVVYQRIDRGSVLSALRRAWEDDASVTALLSAKALQRAREGDDPSGCRALLRQVLATTALQQRPMVLVLDDAESRMVKADGGHAFDDEARTTLLAVFGALDGTPECASRVIVTGRYGFTLVDPEDGRDLLARVERIELHRLDPVDARKLLRQADRYDDEGAPRKREVRKGDRDLRERLLMVGATNARLLALLHRLLVADEARGRAAVAQMEGWVAKQGETRIEEEALVDYLDDLVIDDLLELAGEGGRRLVAALGGLEVAVPQEAVCEAVGVAAEVAARCADLGLVERDEEGLLAVVPLVAARSEGMEEEERKGLMRALLAALPPSWRGDAEGWEGPAERAGFLFRWAADVEPADRALGAAVAGGFLRWLQSRSEATVLRDETPRAERLGLRWQGASALGWAWGTVDGARAARLLDEALAAIPKEAGDEARIALLLQRASVALTAGRADVAGQALTEAASLVAKSDERTRAILSGRRADILESRGDLDEALRIRRQEQLPVYERLGDVHSRAVTMGKIADILHARGDLDETLRIRRQEELPVYERLGDLRSRAHTMGKIADILESRGDLDEALRIRRQEELPAYERLGDLRSRAVTVSQIADILRSRGDLDEALRSLREDVLSLFERLGDLRSCAVTMGKIADILQSRGDLNEALRIRQQEELPVYERLGDVHSRAVTMGKIADILHARGDLDETLRIRRQEELPVYERLGNARERAVTVAKIAEVLWLRGDLDEALGSLREDVLPHFERMEDVRSRTITMGRIAEIELSRGRLDVAREIFEREGLPVHIRMKEPDCVAHILWRIGQIHSCQNNPSEALLHIERAFLLFQRLGHAQGIVAVGQDYVALLQHTGAPERIPAVAAVIVPVARRLGFL